MLQVRQEQQDLQVLRDLRDLTEQQVPLEQRAPLVLQGQRVQRVHQDLQR